MLPTSYELNRYFERYPCRQLLSELQTIGRSRQRRMEPKIKQHAHEGYEICYLVSGQVTWNAPDGEWEVGAGDVYVTRPGEWHGGSGSMRPCEVYWLIVLIPDGSALPGLSMEQTRAIKARLDAMQLRVFPGSRRVLECFQKMMEEHRKRGALSEMSARAALHGMLAEVVEDQDRQMEEERKMGRVHHKAIRSAVMHIDRQPADNWTVEELAGSCGLGVRRFHTLFVQQTGLSPAEYRSQRRVMDAKRLLLESDVSITELSHRLGFSSSQYFSTVFKEFTGETPRGFRRSGGEESDK